ncbi:LysM peptidoglycan-binding domain-containing protein [Paenibacillus sp. NPDC058071]|uniref:LysM peptidoglycan-binding domain-containing protein n=1 Tax=Paenibacillus sp. NPDC058071 TaxID=3346326 RepID=UPI0036D8098C
MLMNPSFYKSIHTKEDAGWSPRRRTMQLSVNRRAAKLIVALAFFILLFTSFLIVGTNASTEPAAVSAGEQIVIVGTGDTLWEIAKLHMDDSKDIRYNVFQLKERNGLSSVNLHPGQQLIVPQ